MTIRTLYGPHGVQNVISTLVTEFSLGNFDIDPNPYRNIATFKALNGVVATRFPILGEKLSSLFSIGIK